MMFNAILFDIIQIPTDIGKVFTFSNQFNIKSNFVIQFNQLNQSHFEFK